MLQNLRQKVAGALHAALGDGDGAGGGGTAGGQHQHEQHQHPSGGIAARAEALVARATSAQLPPDTPDWGATLELVDMINADPPGATPFVLVPLHRVLATPPAPTNGADNADGGDHNGAADAATTTPLASAPSSLLDHRQLLALATLEALVKNCRPQLHTALVNSPLWRPTAAEGGTGVLAAASAGAPAAAAAAAAAPSAAALPARRLFPGAEVRDRALALVEDLARGLPHEPRFMRDYEALVDSGVDFPVRPVGEGQGEGSSASAAYYAAPPEPVGGAAGAAGAAAAGAASDLTDADRAAIAAAQADLEREAALRDAAALGGAASDAQHRPGHAPAALGPAAAWGAPIRPPGYAPPAEAVAHERELEQQQQHEREQQQGASGRPASAATTQQQQQQQQTPQAVPSTEPELARATQVAANSAALLREMTGALAAQVAAGDGAGAAAGAREPFLADLADQCYRYRSLLQEAVMRQGAGFAAATTAAAGGGGGGGGSGGGASGPGPTFSEEATAAALATNDELQRALLGYEAAAAGRAPPEMSGGGGGSAGGAATAAAAAAAAPVAAAAPAAFTLGDDDEDEGDAGLASTRAAVAGLSVADGAAPPPAAK